MKLESTKLIREFCDYSIYFLININIFFFVFCFAAFRWYFSIILSLAHTLAPPPQQH